MVAHGSDEGNKGGANSGVAKSSSTSGDEGMSTTRSTPVGNPIATRDGEAVNDEGTKSNPDSTTVKGSDVVKDKE
jgi:hypothetical protein